MVCLVDRRLTVSTVGLFATLAASELFGPDAAPAPRLATDKSTARLSAKRRRIQLPRSSKVVRNSFVLPWNRSSDARGLARVVSTVKCLGIIN